MKRKTILTLSILFILICLFLLTLFLLYPSLFQKDSDSGKGTQPDSVVQYTVLEGEITHSFECSGKVASDMAETKLRELVIQNANQNNFDMCREKGEKVAKGEPLYRFQNKEHQLDFNGQVVDVQFRDGSVSIFLLNYDDLMIKAQADAKFYDYISYHSNATVSFNGVEYEATVVGIGYEIQDGMFQIELKSAAMLLPGTEVKVSVQTKTKKNGMYLPTEAVLSQGEAYYVKLLMEDGSTKDTTVILGSYFSVEENGNTFSYVEIKSGVTAGDTVVTEKSEEINPGERIKEQYLNE
ncbi:MAG: hypothetical protein SPF51_00210 [Candidatus Fimivicinus sp.]|nr:hypothetical protein [Oscillospiraceae bacterium]MDY5589961.1 hypothetical protein [Candidatus Fimivicinus sp.]